MFRIVSIIGLFAVSCAVLAGAKYSNPVVYYGNSFQGSFGSARSSADNIQYLYCLRQSTAATCWARDASGQSRSCTTTDPAHLTMIDSLGSSSNLYAAYNSDGSCRILLHKVGSVFEPMK